MSNTRKAQPGSGFRQEKFASSPEFNRGLMANLVARRAALVENAEHRELLWFLQLLSHREGLNKVAAELLAKHPDAGKPRPKSTDSDNDIFELSACGFFDSAASELPQFLAELCLNPAARLDADPYWFKGLFAALRKFKAEWIARRREAEVFTSIGQKVSDALDYALEARCMVLIDGLPRIGKTHAAKAWAELHPGSARYVQLESNNDDKTFFRVIAEALGVSVNLNSKARELRERIEAVLQTGQLLLILDNAEWLWPNNVDPDALPNRINWLMTALVNHEVPIGLVTAPQFNKTKKLIEHRTRWTSEQFDGRIGHFEALPESLGMADLENIARAWFPAADKVSIQLLANYAQSSARYLGGMKAVADRARFIAKKQGRETVSRDDIKRALTENILPGDRALEAAAQAANLGPKRQPKETYTLSRLAESSPALPANRAPAAEPAPPGRRNLVEA